MGQEFEYGVFLSHGADKAVVRDVISPGIPQSRATLKAVASPTARPNARFDIPNWHFKRKDM